MHKITFKDIPARLRTYITEGFRKAFRYSDLYKQVLTSARSERKKYNKDGKPAKRPDVGYICAKCEGRFKQKDINVDHIKTVVPLHSKLQDMSFDEYAKAVFSDDLQVLCKPCHHRKTAIEKRIRADLNKLRRKE